MCGYSSDSFVITRDVAVGEAAEDVCARLCTAGRKPNFPLTFSGWVSVGIDYVAINRLASWFELRT